MIKLIIIVAIAAAAIFSLGIIGFRNVKNVKAAANSVWANAGYEVVGYEGYQWGPVRGGDVWYIVRRRDAPGITYHGFLTRWGSEYHIYNLQAIDAIRPGNF